MAQEFRAATVQSPPGPVVESTSAADAPARAPKKRQRRHSREASPDVPDPSDLDKLLRLPPGRKARVTGAWHSHIQT